MYKRPYRKIIYRKKVNILLVQIVNRNLGDTVIADNAAYLIKQSLPYFTKKHYRLQLYDIQSEDYELVREADLIIFDGGGLIKYRQENFHIYVPALLECAREYDIPVYFNCVGVEGFDGGDERCLRLARTLNFECVKGITVRDDINTLREYYLNRELISRLLQENKESSGQDALQKDEFRLSLDSNQHTGPDVLAGTKTGTLFTAAAADTAVFTPEVYGIGRDSQSGVIGLGIVRSRIFEDYGIPEITREYQLDMWQGIVRELEARGYKWKFFVNGLKSDYDFALEVLEAMGRRSEQYLVPRPVESRELVETIASFQGVIACRMHANIIAYALGIPSIGLVWNDKMLFWARRIGYPERFLNSNQFGPERIVQCLADSIAEGVRPCPKKLKTDIIKPLQHFIHEYGARALKKYRHDYLPKPRDWADRLVAAALGGIHMRYTNMNTRKGLEDALQHGFRLLEADIRMTKDKRLVCVNGWSKGSYEKLGADPAQYEDGMDYETFMKCRMYGAYETMDAEELFARMKQAEGNWKMILDIGKPDREVLSDMIEALRSLCASGEDWQEHLMIRLQGKYDVEMVQMSGLPMQLMYYVPPKQKREEKNLTLDSIGKFCKKREIKWVSIAKEALDEELMTYLHKQKLKTCLFSYNRYTDVLKALELGTDWIATSYLSPQELNEQYERGWTVVIRQRVKS